MESCMNSNDKRTSSIGVLATDSAERFGLPLKFAPADLQAELKKFMPEFGSAKNPVDLTGMAYAEWYYQTVKLSLTHPWVNGLVILVRRQPEPSLRGRQGRQDRRREDHPETGAHFVIIYFLTRWSG